jgi:endonuclease/exonuclease/phosphatase family metal-dependent hydrolase
VKIISWNMGCGYDTGGYRKYHQAALDWLRAQKPDVALLQEVELARLAGLKGMAVHSVPTSIGAITGSAIATKAAALEPVRVEIDGALVAAARTRLGGADFVLASTHVLTDDREHKGRQRRALGTFVTKLADVVAGGRCIIGGDFNASLHWREYGDWFFEPMRAAGFHDTRPHHHEIQSYWGRGSTSVIQDDHVFVDEVSKAVVSRGSWNIMSGEDHRRWSDHGPVVVDAGVKDRATSSRGDADAKVGDK